MIPDEIEELAFQHLPDEFWRRMIPALFDAHKSAHDTTYSEFERPEANDLLGFTRRAKVEANLRGAASLFPDVMTVENVKARQGPWNHVEVRSGPVVLTASTVTNPGDMVEKAEFRESLAYETNTLRLDIDDESQSDSEHLSLYAILIHSKFRTIRPEDHRYRYLPGSAYLVFPNRGCDHYLHTVNLFDRYARIVDSLMPQEWDKEAQIRYYNNARRIVAA